MSASHFTRKKGIDIHAFCTQITQPKNRIPVGALKMPRATHNHAAKCSPTKAAWLRSLYKTPPPAKHASSAPTTASTAKPSIL